MVLLRGCSPPTRIPIPRFCASTQQFAAPDAALKFEPETSSAMGFGFAGRHSLGCMHMEIVQEAAGAGITNLEPDRDGAIGDLTR